MNELLALYLEDFKDTLIVFSESLMKAQGGNRSNEVVNSIFRVAHTIKGNSGGAEFYNIEKVMHIMENTLQEIRDGKRKFNDQMLKMLLSCHDFLEDSVYVIEELENDKSIDTSKILSEIEKILKSTELNMVEEKNVIETPIINKDKNKDENNISFKKNSNKLPNIDIELISVLIDNCKRGYQVYKLKVEFIPQCKMKNVKSWMVFQKVDLHATFVFSIPERIDEEAFKNSEFNIDGEFIEIFVISNKDIDILKNDIMSISDISSVEVDTFNIQSLESEKARIEGEVEVLHLLKDVEVNLLDMEKREINKESLLNVEKSICKIIQVGENVLDKYIVNMSKDVLTLIKYFKENEEHFENTDIELIAFLVNKIEEFIEDSSLLKNLNLLQEVDNILKMAKQNIQYSTSRIGERLIESNVIKQDDVRDVLAKQKENYPNLKFGQIAVKEDKASAYQLMQVMKEKNMQKNIVKETSFIRVPTNKVDSLMDMLGELLILNSQMEQKVAVSECEDNDISNILSRSVKLIKVIQLSSMSLRMVQIKPTIHRLTRIIRDTASELNKKVNIEIDGEETEIDRSAAEKLFDPLMHLVRNAVSHGIEDEVDRVKLGKKAEGKVTLRVYSKRGNVYVEVEDDGKGINIEKIRQKAKKIGLIIDGKEYSDDELINFIFHPGFSTQEEINNIAGRGVGMNVVESEVNKMGGKVEVITREGVGSTFIVRIPMNLAVINGTVVEISGSKYIIPTLFIKEFCIPQTENWITMQGQNKGYMLRNTIVPVLTPTEFFDEDLGEANIEDKELIIFELEKKYLAFPVDKILSRQDIVSKPLDREFLKLGFASGASILGDGQVTVILDVESMFKLKKG